MEQEAIQKSQLTIHTNKFLHYPHLNTAVHSSPSNSLFKPKQICWIANLNYNPGTIIGRGSFGQVFKATDKRTDMVYALKIIDKVLVDSPNSMSIINREIDILSHINHPHIIRLLNHYEDSNSIYILMPYVSNGQLYTEIQKTNHLNDSFAAQYAFDVISAISYLHSLKPKVLHRDIKSENILLDDNKEVILTDFGTSNYLEEGETRKTYCGSPEYLAPEIIKGLEYDERVDIWAIGILLFEMLTGATPFQGETLIDTKRNICRLKIEWPTDLSPLAKNLISKILKQEPKERMTLEQIMNHPFFSKVDKKDRDDDEDNYLGVKCNKKHIDIRFYRKDSLSLFHKKSIDESIHPLLNQIKTELDLSHKEISKLKTQIAGLQSTNEDLLALNITLSNENLSIQQESMHLITKIKVLQQTIDDLNNTIHEKDLSVSAIQFELIKRESMLQKENLFLSSEYQKLSFEYNELRTASNEKSSIKTNYNIEDFQLEILNNSSSTISSSFKTEKSAEVKNQLKEIEAMLKETKDSFMKVICSNCKDIKAISSFYKENTEYIRQCYLNTFTSLNSVIYQMDNDVKQSIKSTITFALNHNNNSKMIERINWLTEQNDLLLKYKEEHIKQEITIERLENNRAILMNQNELMKKEMNVYLKLIEQLHDTITYISSEMLEMKLKLSV